jgi:hypothetical protein
VILLYALCTSDALFEIRCETVMICIIILYESNFRKGIHCSGMLHRVDW